MSDIEQCFACTTPEKLVSYTDNVALCNRHWNAFLIRYLGADDSPCGAHLILEEAP